ncbi:FtsK/SpoIIIE domain-containing protein [Geosporobacter ferrireducens]|uniref:FtsK/SpoIIIE domain-containing protein n=1 Tax=Geosporobacter ferrireducens TaxID=1424294 RepID=UPI00139F1247|nr:FtsK/SpoIIIE domain-containing protein [Geosporobacter ferrireducens]MTI53774.1 hypothetical protein [Geosporobacter ferrireducens]
MAKNESEKFTDNIMDFFAKTAFISLMVGVGSFFMMRTNFVKEHPGLENYAIEGQKIGFGLFAMIIAGHFIWINRTKLLEGLISLLGKMLMMVFTVSKSILSGSFSFSKLLSFRDTAAEEETAATDSSERVELKGLPSLDVFPAQPKFEIEKSGEIIAKELPAGLKRIGMDEALIKSIKVVSINDGPSSSFIEIALPDGLKQSSMENAARDLEAALGVPSLEIIKGSAAGQAGIIVGKEKRTPVYLRTLLESKEFKMARKKMILPIPIGIDPKGKVEFADLTEFPHALVAGATKSGKSVWLNAVIGTLAYLKGPKELKLLLTDPKRVEFPFYEPLPHVARIETDPMKAIVMKEELVKEMDLRYKLFQEKKARNIQAYNEKVSESEQLPYIVDVVDEYFDLIMVGGIDALEPLFVRLGQLARGAGIHLIIATQRPSVKVVTPVLKGNLQTRICFSLATMADYNTVFGTQAGNNFKLRGRGDGVARIEGRLEGNLRFQGAAISVKDQEVEESIINLANYWRENTKESKLDFLNQNLVEDNLIEENVKEERKNAKNSDKQRLEELSENEEREDLEPVGEILTHLYGDLETEGVKEDEETKEESSEDDLEYQENPEDDLEYLIALKIVEQIDNTPEGKEILISARKIRDMVNRNMKSVQDIFNDFVNKNYIEPARGKGYLVLNEEVFYSICDEYES